MHFIYLYFLFLFRLFLFFVIYKNTPRNIKVLDVVPDNSNETPIDNTVQQLQIDTNQQVEQIKEDREKQLKQAI